MKSFILISQYYYPEQISTGQILTELSAELHELGWRVDAVSAQPSYYQTQKVPKRITVPGTSIVVRRVRNLTLNKNRLLGKILNYSSITLGLCWRQIMLPTGSVILTVTNPAVYPIVAAFVARIRKQRLVIIVHDVYPEILVALKYLSASCQVVKTWRRLDEWAHSVAYASIVLGNDMMKALRGRSRTRAPNRVLRIPNWSIVEPLSENQRASNPLFFEYPILDKKFIVLYSGNLGLFHPIEAIIKAAELVQQSRYVDILFVFIGGGGKLKLAKEMVMNRSLENVVFLPYQSKERLPYSLGLANIGLVSLSKGVEGLAVPSKLYGLMAAGKPIIANVPIGSEVAEVLRDERCGFVCDPDDSTSLANLILRVYGDRSLEAELGHRSREAAESTYSLLSIAAQYNDLLTEVSS